MPSFNWERKILNDKKNKGSVAGVDEAGRGAWAGPVVVAMVILNPKNFSSEIKDSKKLSPIKREFLAKEIKKSALGYSISIISERIIEEENILKATLIGVSQCSHHISPYPGHLLLDALLLPELQIAQTKLIKGDEISYSIAAASILAKTTRDKLMISLSKKYPVYGFERHKGYGVKLHREALKQFGPCPLHRKTFRPIREYNEKLFTR